MGTGRQSAKLEVLVIYGGRSTEHEISCRSAAFLMRHLDPAKYTVRAIGIDKDGQWLPQDMAALTAGIEQNGVVPILRQGAGARSLPGAADPAGSLLALGDGAGSAPKDVVVFPILHGTFGEDGTMQGLLEMAEVAFVGPDTLGSAVGMDKVMSKRLAQAAGIPVVPWIDTKRQYWAEHGEQICRTAVRELGFPLFVKPVRLGSSVGVTKVTSAAELKAACEAALAYDDKIMIEKGVAAREIEVAVLGDYEPTVSVPGEVIPKSEFYSYDAKYLDPDGAGMAIPAQLDAVQTRAAQDLARRTFVALELYGMARVDLFLDKASGEFFLNEVNTIPGFTEISQYPLLWKASGVAHGELLDRLIALAIKRRDIKRALKRAR